MCHFDGKHVPPIVSPFVESLRELLQQMTFVSDQSSTCIGRPRVAIEEDQIRFLVENGFRHCCNIWVL